MTETLSREQEEKRTAKLIDIANRRQGDTWTVDEQNGSYQVIALRATGEDALICTIHPDALADEIELISAALKNVGFLLMLRSRAADILRDLRKQLGRKAPEDCARRASILLSDRRFQRFLEEKGAGGPVRDKGQADTRLKSLLAIDSKKRLNDTPAARDAWLKLHGDFEIWLRGGR